MTSTIWITPTSNIKDRGLLEENKIEKHIYDSDNDFLIFINKKTGEMRNDNLINISIYDDVILNGNVEYKILRMLSK